MQCDGGGEDVGEHHADEEVGRARRRAEAAKEIVSATRDPRSKHIIMQTIIMMHADEEVGRARRRAEAAEEVIPATRDPRSEHISMLKIIMIHTCMYACAYMHIYHIRA